MNSDSVKQSYLARDLKHMLHGNTVPSEVRAGNVAYIVEGKGTKVKDIHGKEYLDTISGGLTTFLGYGNEELVETARSQMAKLHHYPDFATRASLTEIDLATRLSEITPGKLNRFSFTNSGSDANETAFKLVRFYWREMGTDKYKIIALDSAYHGATLAALSVCGYPAYLGGGCFEPLPAGFYKVGSPYCYRCPFGKSYPSCGIECARAVEEAIEKEGEDTVAAFIAEPLVNAAGNFIPPKEYWPMVRDICTRHNVLLIIDEYIVGFGRTGKFWCCEHSNLEPDIMMFAKGLASGYMPIAGIGVSEDIYDGMVKADKPFPHVFTYGGHTVSCAVALKTIDIIFRDKLVEKAARMGADIQARFDALKEMSPCVGDVRGIGLDFAIEFVEDKSTKKPLAPAKVTQMKNRMLEKGVIVGGMGLHKNLISLVPPLTISDDELDYVLSQLEKVVLEVKP